MHARGKLDINMKIWTRLVAIAVSCAFCGPVLADTTAPAINPATWTRVALSGGTYEVQNVSSTPVYLTTGASTPLASSAGTVLLPNDRICRSVTTGDLYARGTGVVTVTTGLTCGSSVGSGSGPNPAQDGTDASGVTSPAGGAGLRGWLSGIYQAVTGTLNVSATSLPLPAHAATDTAQATQTTALATLDTDLKTPLKVVSSGSTGTDASANPPALPVVGAAFGAGGPYANYVLVKTVAASPTRLNIEVENDSGAQIVLVRDDGTATAGTAPANATVWSLGGSSLGVGYQGGGYSSTTFKGRLQIYAPAATAQVAVKLD